MKHPVKETWEIIGWTILSLAFGIAAMPNARIISSSMEIPWSPILTVLFILSSILFGAFFWIVVMKYWRPSMARGIFSFGVGALIARATGLIVPTTPYSIRFAIGAAVGITYALISIQMQKSWKFTLNWYWIQNAIMAIILPTVAVVFGMLMPPWAAIILLGAVAIYDAIAVWKTKHMIGMAMYFVEMRVLPGIAVPYKGEEGKFAILGGGDIFFIMFVAASFFKTSLTVMYVTIATMALSVVALFLFSKKNKFYPAIPFIFAGCLIGVALALVFV